MAVTELLGSLGSWSVALRDDAPKSILSQLDYYGHIVIMRGRVDIGAVDQTALLLGARYVGPMRELDETVLSGNGMVFWLGDEEDKGWLIEGPLTLTNRTLALSVSDIIAQDPSVSVGNVQTGIPGTYSNTFRFLSPRKALQMVCDSFGVEFRVNGDGSVDVGQATWLYNTTPTTIVSSRHAGKDLDLSSLGGKFDVGKSVVDYSSRIVLVGQSFEDGVTTQLVTGIANAAVVPYKDIRGNTVRMTRLISESTEPAVSANTTAQLNLNRFNRVGTSLKVTAEDYEITGTFKIGDSVYIFDPDNGIYDAAREVFFNGAVINPDVSRIAGLTWQITEGHTVLFRTGAGVFIDLTPYVAFETNSADDITVGDLPKSLTGTGNPVTDRLPPVADASVPNAPTSLGLVSSSYIAPDGQNYATVTASWTAPTQNTDSSTIVDFSHYVVNWRVLADPFGAEIIIAGPQVSISDITPGVTIAVKVAAVDLGNRRSAWTTEQQIVAAADNTAPSAPADPVVSSYYGQLRVFWNGLMAGAGTPPSDFNRVEVHVSAITGFTPDLAANSGTRISSLATAGAAFVTAPYGATRYVKLVAFDHAGNPSASSGQVSGATVQIGALDYENLSVGNAAINSLDVGKLTAGQINVDVLMVGRLATALTLARVEFNPLGLQKWNSSNQLMVSITGTTNLLTGQIQSALAGERFIMNPGGTNPSRIDLYPSSGSAFASIEAETVFGEAAVTISANNADHTLNSGVILVRKGFAHMFYGRPDLAAIPTEIYVDPGTARMTAGIVDIIVDDAKASPGGDRFAMVMRDGSGKLANSQLNYWMTGVQQPWFAAVNQDSGIIFANGNIRAVGNNATTRDIACRTLFYDVSLVGPSSRSIKSDIVEASTVIDIRAATKKAKSKKYKLEHLAEPARAADDKFGATEAIPAPEHIGLIAEEMPEAVQAMVPNAVNGEDVLGYDRDAVISLTWSGLGDAFEDIDKILPMLDQIITRLTALENKDKPK